ncbi:MAG: cytochrome c [Alphaproteobacteria bacterium]|nr:cytochrome c [Alphaproteobacteria bacterium]
MPAWLAAAAGLAVLAAAPAETSAPRPGVAHGARVAQRQCAGCHAVGSAGRSPNSGAPTFRDLSQRYSPLALEESLKRVSTQGHFEMRARSISSSEAADLAAYIESLSSPDK